MSRAIRLTQIDGKLPNLALMKLARHHRERGDEITFTKHVERGLLEGDYQVVYGSAIFSFSADRVARFLTEFPGAIVGGTWNTNDNRTVESTLGVAENENYDYSIYPGFDGSIGFTARGCRLKCGFCVVPKKEGKPGRFAQLRRYGAARPTPSIFIFSIMISSASRACNGKPVLMRSAAAGSRFALTKASTFG
jgi:hypothetical protein